ncbi:hypothetical protein [Ekhidna sp.]|uniref:hypothetical protein n=1 Tax=Ekhidna sp. TaxID=2608089 RepID=UPI0032EB448B
MKYNISVEGPVSKHLSELLIPELARFDIRAEIQTLELNKRIISKALKDFKPDLLVAIGSNKSKPIIRLANKRKVRTCFFHQSLLEGNTGTSIYLKTDKSYLDLPINKPDASYIGSLLYELVRKHESSIESDRQTSLVTILTSSQSEMKHAQHLAEKLSRQVPNIDFKTTNIADDIKLSIEMARNSNAMIAMDQLSNMFGVFTNCPVINVYRKTLLNKPANETSIINSLLEEKVITSIPIKRTSKIAVEIEKTLNDHQQCASIMDSYQQLKSMIGMAPVARQAAQEIVDWLEEDN